MVQRQVCLLGLAEKGEGTAPGRAQSGIFHWELEKDFLHMYHLLYMVFRTGRIRPASSACLKAFLSPE